MPDRVFTSGHMTKMVVTPFDLPYQKTTCYTQTSWLYVFCRNGVMADRSFTVQKYAFSSFSDPVTLTLTRWPSDRTWPIFHGDTPDMQKTSAAKL